MSNCQIADCKNKGGYNKTTLCFKHYIFTLETTCFPG